MPNLTPVSRAYGTYQSKSVRVVRPLAGTTIDPSAWERRDRFVRGRPTVAKGADQVVLTQAPLQGDDAVWARIHKAFKKHEDPLVRAFFAAEIIRKLPAKQRTRLTNEFWEQYPLLIPAFLLNVWAPEFEALLAQLAKIGREFWETLVSDFAGLASPVKKKDVKAWNSTATGTRPAKRP